MRKLILAACLAFCATLAVSTLPTDTHAQGVQIRPLMYEETLEPGETKKGFVDISNPANREVSLTTHVQGFKQIDGAGNLEFFDVDYLNDAIQLDFTEFTLGPKEAMRLYFTIDSKKMPEGDIFAALFARTQPGDSTDGVATSAEVGTLLVIENGNGGPRSVELSDLSLPYVSIGTTIGGSVNVKNTANPEDSTGFFPQLTAKLGPVFETEEKFKGPLVFAGITRTVGFELPSNHFGFYNFTVSSHGTEANQWMFLITGWWRWVVLAVVLAATASFVTWRLVRKRHIRYKRHP